MHHHRKILDSAVHRDRGMWGRGRAARLVGSVISLSVAPHYGRAGRSCGDHARWLSRGWPRRCVRCGGLAGVAQKKRPPACLVSRCHRVHAFGDFVLMRKAGTWLALELL